MAVMSASDESMGAETRHGAYARSMPDVSGRKVPVTEVTAAEVSTPEVTTTPAVSAALSRGSISGKRQAAKRKNCGQRKD
jgi:hypothetical protein